MDPGINEAEAIELSTAHKQESFQGQGKITLDIPSIDYHFRRPLTACRAEVTDEYYFKPKSESVLKVVVHIINVKEKRTGSINVGVNFKGAGGSFTHEWEWEKGLIWTKGRGFGMKASAGGTWVAYWNPEIRIQGKTAKVDGYVEDAGLPTLNAEYAKRNSWCPYSSDPDGRKYIPHYTEAWF